MTVDTQTTDGHILLFCAVRYALGRMTYVVGSVAGIVREAAPTMRPDQCRAMIRDIDEAGSRSGGLGMGMDIAEWMSARKALASRIVACELVAPPVPTGEANHE